MHRRRLAPVLAFFIVAALAGALGWRHWREHRYDAQILVAARRYQLDPALVKAVVWRETFFQADARGRAGELGLMQLREPAAREWAEAERVAGFTHEHVLDPGTNTLAGAWYLAKLLKRYPKTDNPTAFALADYNAGRTHVLRWATNRAVTNSAAFLEQMTFPGTRRYIETVLARCERYQEEFREK